MKNQRGNAEVAVLLAIGLFFGALLVGGTALKERNCRVYGEETGRETKYKVLRGGCYVQMDNGKWRQRAEVRSREEFEE